MVSERCPSIVDWLSDVEASVHLQNSSSRDPSLSAPSLTSLKHPRKRKHRHHSDISQAYIEKAHFDRPTRKPLCEIMEPNSTKRRRTDTVSENEEQAVALEVRIISQVTALSSSLTITNSIVVLKRLKKASPPHHPSPPCGHPRPPCLPGPSQRPQVAPERRVHLR